MPRTAAAAPSATVHAWDRFEGMWVAMFHLALGVPTVWVLVGSGVDPLRWAGLLGAVAVVVVARHLAVRALAGVQDESRRHRTVGLLWAAATLPAMVLLVNAEDAFFFAVYGLFPQAFLILPRNWAIGVSAALVPAVLLGSEGVSALNDPGLVSVVGSALLAPAIGLFIHAISHQSEQRHRAILALEAAQEEAESLLQAGLAISRARTAQEVAAAVGACLSDQGVKTVALHSTGERLAAWPSPDSGDDADGRLGATVTVDGPGTDPDSTLSLEVSGTAALTAASRRTLETLATSCGLALANLELVEQARRTGVLEERARLAREIHDTLAQGFVSVLTQLEAAGEHLPGTPAEVLLRVQAARDIARASLGEARRSVQALRPAALDVAPLSEAIQRVVTRWSEDAGVGALVTVTGTPVTLPSASEVALLRATQEALANVARHADATSVIVTLSFAGDAVVLDVHDDGRGFDIDAPPNGSGGGFGLEALRQRVDGSGGFFGVESEPGVGTTVTVHIPVAEASW